MSTKEIKFVNVDEKLGKDKFFVDEENAHIVLLSLIHISEPTRPY